MTEIVRTRDVVILAPGLRTTLAVTAAVAQTGWAGGTGFMWFDAPDDELMVTFSDGERGAGFALWGSNEDSDVLTSMSDQQAQYRYVVIGSGSFLLSTRTFEHFTYASRLAGPLVPITFTPREALYWSLRGWLTNEDEWTLSGDPRAPNTYAVANVVQIPSAVTNNYLTIQTIL